jgi:purine-binding chemotaxis protein CheW
MDNRRVITFYIGEDRFSLDVAFVRSIERVGPLTRVPGTPAGVAGIMNCRGEIIAVLNLVPWGIAHAEPAEFTRVIIAEAEGETIGILVSRVEEMSEATANSGQASVLDLAQVLKREELEQLRNHW